MLYAVCTSLALVADMQLLFKTNYQKSVFFFFMIIEFKFFSKRFEQPVLKK